MTDGRRAPWTPERRAAHSANMRKRWQDPTYRKRQTAIMAAVMADPTLRAEASVRMKLLNARMRDDNELRGKCIRGQKRVRRKPDYRAMQSIVQKDVMRDPARRRQAKYHCIKINKNPKVRKRQVAGCKRAVMRRTRATSAEAYAEGMV